MRVIPFTANPGAAIDGDEVHLTSGTSFEVRVVTPGGSAGSYGVQRPPQSTADMDDAYREMFSRNFSGSQLESFLEMLENEAVPEFAPAYSRLLRRSTGETWARIYTVDPLAAGTRDVYSADRRLLGQVRTPERFRVLQLTEDAVWGISFDEFYVEYVSKYLIGP